MRRNRFGVFLFALALAVQAFASAAANVAMAAASANSRLSLQICQPPGELVGDRQSPPGDHDRQRNLCPLCQLACSGVAPLEVAADVGSLAPVRWTALARRTASHVWRASRHGSPHQARAPPRLS